MSILFGHPTGNPNSHNAALAHYESGQLNAFCVPWMPSNASLKFLSSLPGLDTMAKRLTRRRFEPLENAALVQGRVSEWHRLALRAIKLRGNDFVNDANDWLMQTMSRECRRSSVTVVHSYEDCSLLQFNVAKHMNKACIYDLPIGYYSAWEDTESMLTQRYFDWLPPGGLLSSRFVRPMQKRQEMDLADLVLVPSEFVAETVSRFHPTKTIAIAPYGVNSDEWVPPDFYPATDKIVFMFAGQCSLRKGIPLLLEAWEKACLPDAKLVLVGNWQLNENKKSELPDSITWFPPLSKASLLSQYQAAQVFILPTFFEGRALVVGEAMASGLPVLTTTASGASDLINDQTGRLFEIGNIDALVASLRWFSDRREDLPQMSKASRAMAEQCTWGSYRNHVTHAVAPFI